MLEWRLECKKKLYVHLSVHTTNFFIPLVSKLCNITFVPLNFPYTKCYIYVCSNSNFNVASYTSDKVTSKYVHKRLLMYITYHEGIHTIYTRVFLMQQICYCIYVHLLHGFAYRSAIKQWNSTKLHSG